MVNPLCESIICADVIARWKMVNPPCESIMCGRCYCQVENEPTRVEVGRCYSPVAGGIATVLF